MTNVSGHLKGIANLQRKKLKSQQLDFAGTEIGSSDSFLKLCKNLVCNSVLENGMGGNQTFRVNSGYAESNFCI